MTSDLRESCSRLTIRRASQRQSSGASARQRRVGDSLDDAFSERLPAVLLVGLVVAREEPHAAVALVRQDVRADAIQEEPGGDEMRRDAVGIKQ